MKQKTLQMRVRLFAPAPGGQRWLRRACVLLAVAVAAGCSDSPTETEPPSRINSTFLSYESSAGDPIGEGQTRRYTPADGQFRMQSSPNYVRVRLSVDQVLWELFLAAPEGKPLERGTYENAARFPFPPPGQPGLSLSRTSRGCNTLTGSFVVHELVRNGALVERLHATFVQNCEGTMPPLRGEIAYIASAAH